ncbi:hypothetical protein MMC30_006050 [Trapelia coarctata]|nr:hypothetical protein [Trapelia coarctata]
MNGKDKSKRSSVSLHLKQFLDSKDFVRLHANKADVRKGRTITSSNKPLLAKKVAQTSTYPTNEDVQVEKNFSIEANPINPRLFAVDDNGTEVEPATLETLGALVFGEPSVTSAQEDPQSFNDGEVWSSEAIQKAIEDAYLDQSLAPKDDHATPDKLTPNAFVEWFAKVNMFKLSSSFKQNDSDEAVKRSANRNNRDPPLPIALRSWPMQLQNVEPGRTSGTPASVSREYQQSSAHGKFDTPMCCPSENEDCNNPKKLFKGEPLYSSILSKCTSELTKKSRPSSQIELVSSLLPARSTVRLMIVTGITSRHATGTFGCT